MSIRRAALWSLASQYASFAIQFVTSIIISRLYLLPADVGLFSIALAAAMMVSIFQDMGFSRFITGQPQMRMEHIRDYAAVAVGAGVLVMAVLLGAAVPLASFYGEPGLSGLMMIIAASFLVQAFSIVPVALLTRELDFRRLFTVNAGSALAGALASIGLAAKGFGPSALAWGMLASALFRVIVALGFRPVLPGVIRRFETIRPLLGFSSSSFLISLSGSIGQRSQDLIVGRILGTAATGLFTRASALAGQMSTLVVGAINSVFYPAFARKRDAGEPLGEPYLHLIACNTALNFAAAIGLALAAEPLVHLLYGPRWMEVAPLLRWTAIAEVFFVAVPLQMDIPILLGRIRTLVWINFLDTALTVALLAIFARWGLETAAISRVVVAVLWFAIYITYIKRLLGLRTRQLADVYLRSAVVGLAAGLPLALAIHFEWFGTIMGFLPLLALSLGGVASWLLAMIIVRHPAREEIRMILDRLAAGLLRRKAA
ncbi:MAG TPA: oligosaccharide flippase family protein [Novosphingobium sp.]|nr:oligosaccharide flippase family protein [Novosphingobium sp.]